MRAAYLLRGSFLFDLISLLTRRNWINRDGRPCDTPLLRRREESPLRRKMKGAGPPTQKAPPARIPPRRPPPPQGELKSPTPITLSDLFPSIAQCLAPGPSLPLRMPIFSLTAITAAAFFCFAFLPCPAFYGLAISFLMQTRSPPFFFGFSVSCCFFSWENRSGSQRKTDTVSKSESISSFPFQFSGDRPKSGHNDE